MRACLPVCLMSACAMSICAYTFLFLLRFVSVSPSVVSVISLSAVPRLLAPHCSPFVTNFVSGGMAANTLVLDVLSFGTLSSLCLMLPHSVGVCVPRRRSEEPHDGSARRKTAEIRGAPLVPLFCLSLSAVPVLVSECLSRVSACMSIESPLMRCYGRRCASVRGTFTGRSACPV